MENIFNPDDIATRIVYHPGETRAKKKNNNPIFIIWISGGGGK